MKDTMHALVSFKWFIIYTLEQHSVLSHSIQNNVHQQYSLTNNLFQLFFLLSYGTNQSKLNGTHTAHAYSENCSL